jgi:SAM-dependent methyltransferase
MIDVIKGEPVELEYPTCPLCQGSERTMGSYKFGEHEVVRCEKCLMHYLYPRLTESAMRRFYETDTYFEGGEAGYSDTSYSDQERALRSTFRRLMQNLRKRGLAGGSLLEVGCGFGYLLEEAKEFFSYRVGTEFSPEGVRRSSPKADIIYEGGTDQLPADAKFDCIIATHVIEHVYQPLEFVKKLMDHAKPGATIVLATPDMGGMLRKAMGRRWASFKVPEHVLYFDATTLGAVMSQAGLTDIKVMPYPHAFPLALIGSKLGLSLPASWGKTNIWIPATTVALYAKVANGDV